MAKPIDAETRLRQKATCFGAVRDYGTDRGLTDKDAEALAFAVVDYLDDVTDSDVLDFVAKSQARHLEHLRNSSSFLTTAARAVRDIEIAQLEGQLLLLKSLATEVKNG